MGSHLDLRQIKNGPCSDVSCIRFKFRIWCDKQKTMIHNLTIWQNDNDISYQGFGQTKSALTDKQAGYKDKASILMESTGLKDKNGKLI